MLFSHLTHSQTEPPELDSIIIVEDDCETIDCTFDEVIECNDQIFDFVQVEAKFPGGEEALVKFIKDSIDYYQSEPCLGGRVYVQFVVNRDGSLSEIKIIRGAHPILDKVTMDVIRKMPAWIPGEMAGKKVRTRFVLPIYFNCG